MYRLRSQGRCRFRRRSKHFDQDPCGTRACTVPGAENVRASIRCCRTDSQRRHDSRVDHRHAPICSPARHAPELDATGALHDNEAAVARRAAGGLSASTPRRINDRHAGSDKAIDIARDESKCVYLGRRGQQGIDEEEQIGNAQRRPRICNRLVDEKHAVAKAPSHLPEPALQRPSLLRVTSALQFDAATYLCDNYDACSDPLGRRWRDKSGHVRMRSVALAKLGNDVRIDQKPRSFSLRQSRSRGWSNTPAKASSGRSEANISNAVISAGLTNAFSSADRRALAFSGSPRDDAAAFCPLSDLLQHDTIAQMISYACFHPRAP
jgi:hypothetical protein